MRRWTKHRLRNRVFVHTKDDQTIEGVIVAEWADGIQLGDARFHGDKPVPMAGETFVPHTNVAFIQRAGHRS
jgi:hypothetical protein